MSHMRSVSFAGIHFEVALETVFKDFMTKALQVFFGGVSAMLGSTRSVSKLSYSLDCRSVGSDHKWEAGAEFYKCVRFLAKPIVCQV